VAITPGLAGTGRRAYEAAKASAHEPKVTVTLKGLFRTVQP
jgi:hypothetical protein